MKLLRRLVLNGDPGDSRVGRWEFLSALSLWSCLCLLLSAIVIARAAGAALFLGHYGGRELAMVYVLVGLAVVAILYGISWLTHGMRYDRVAIGTIAFLGMGTVLFRVLILWAVGEREHRWVYAALYVFLETFALVTTMQVWTLANSLFSSAQAKRLYVFIATGGIVGSLLGGLTVRTLWFVPTADLLWIIVGFCPLMIGAVHLFRVQAERLRQVVVKESDVVGWGRGGLRPVSQDTVRWIRHPVFRQRPVLRLAARLALLAFLVAFTTNLVDFYFKTYADNQFHGDTAGLTRFFGDFYLLVGCSSLGMQLLVTPAIVRRSSVFVGLALMPTALSVGTFFNFLGATLARATLLKLFDSGFAHSVQRSCTEMLYTPLPPNLTGEVKLLSEGVAGRVGLVSSGLMLFVLAPVLDTDKTLTMISVLLAGWFLSLLVLKKAYRASSVPAPKALPASSTEARMLNGRNRSGNEIVEAGVYCWAKGSERVV